MKYSLLVLFVLAGCNLATLDGNIEGVITGPRTVPASVSEIENILHGGNNRTWKAHSFSLMGNPGFQDCRLDDQVLITNTGLYKYDGGMNLCGAEDSQKLKGGEWFVSNGQLVFTENDQSVYRADILGLVEDTLVVRGSYLGLEIKGLYISN